MKTIKITVDNANGGREFEAILQASPGFNELQPGTYSLDQVVKELVEIDKRF